MLAAEELARTEGWLSEDSAPCNEAATLDRLACKEARSLPEVIAEVEARGSVVAGSAIVVAAAPTVEESRGFEEGVNGGGLEVGVTTGAVVEVTTTEVSAFGAENSDRLGLGARLGAVKDDEVELGFAKDDEVELEGVEARGVEVGGTTAGVVVKTATDNVPSAKLVGAVDVPVSIIGSVATAVPPELDRK